MACNGETDSKVSSMGTQGRENYACPEPAELYRESDFWNMLSRNEIAQAVLYCSQQQDNVI